MTDRTPTTATLACTHEVIQTWGDGTTAVMWACSLCKVRFYPACCECVDVGHRNVVHEARASLDVDRLRAAAQAVVDWSSDPHHRLDPGTESRVNALRAALEEPPT